MKLAAVLVVVLFPLSVFAKDIKQDFSVEGWSCAGCANKTAKALLSVKGIKSATPNLDKKVIAVTFDDAVLSAADVDTAIKKSKPGCD